MSQVKLNAAVVREVSPATVTLELSLDEAIALRDLLYCGVIAEHPLIGSNRPSSLCNALLNALPIEQCKRQWRLSHGKPRDLEKIHE